MFYSIHDYTVHANIYVTNRKELIDQENWRYSVRTVYEIKVVSALNQIGEYKLNK